MGRYFVLHDDQSQAALLSTPAVTNNLESRLWFHDNASPGGFTKRYRADRLVFYEEFDNSEDAIARGKEIKRWRREKTNTLVRTLNPKWGDPRDTPFDGY